ncbi:MAG: ribonuclease Z [archaeon]|jgi:ribonuclease Z|nr:ribonuclease Z [archaeon]MDD2477870.1 ribonuclease Z [Candidatus ainarchaeum sp.]MDD4220897.1 ribonuclease Z [Candidatus ainarchaeum sp.]MDD4662698.1 ribonuclease Z [Candidatus ainarchaeum sp.]
MSNKIKIYFLGTSSSCPTKTRSLTSVLLNYQGVNYLFDSPENIQQQIMKVNQSIIKIDYLFITHLHGDHYFGVVGLLATMQLNQRDKDFNIYVPFGDKQQLLNFISASKLQFGFKINVFEVKANYKLKLEKVIVTAIKLNHSIPSYGYNFKIVDKLGRFDKQKALKLNIPEGPLFRKLQEGKSIKLNGKTITSKQVMDYKFKKIGKSISYLVDTFVLSKVPKSVVGNDILIHEATFTIEHKEKAKETLHSVSKDVGLFAKKAKVKKLYLVHISPRYLDSSETLKEVKKFFKNSFCPNDLDVIEIEDYN